MAACGWAICGAAHADDINGNWLPDDWERAYGWTVTAGISGETWRGDEDPDGDGLRNMVEYQYGTNPNVPDAVLTLSLAIGNPAITFDGEALGPKLSLHGPALSVVYSGAAGLGKSLRAGFDESGGLTIPVTDNGEPVLYLDFKVRANHFRYIKFTDNDWVVFDAATSEWRLNSTVLKSGESTDGAGLTPFRRFTLMLARPGGALRVWMDGVEVTPSGGLAMNAAYSPVQFFTGGYGDDHLAVILDDLSLSTALPNFASSGWGDTTDTDGDGIPDLDEATLTVTDPFEAYTYGYPAPYNDSYGADGFAAVERWTGFATIPDLDAFRTSVGVNDAPAAGLSRTRTMIKSLLFQGIGSGVTVERVRGWFIPAVDGDHTLALTLEHGAAPGEALLLLSDNAAPYSAVEAIRFSTETAESGTYTRPLRAGERYYYELWLLKPDATKEARLDCIGPAR